MLYTSFGQEGSRAPLGRRLSYMRGPTLSLLMVLICLSPAAAETIPAKWHGDKKGAVSVTFDDGLRSQFQNAFPVLQQHNIKATFFIISGDVGVDPYSRMDQCDIQELAADGQEIASHTVTHSKLARLRHDDVVYELQQSQSYLQQLTGQKVHTLAYPYGNYDQDVMDVARDYYIAARSTLSWAINSASPDEDEFYELLVIAPHEDGPGDENALAYLQYWVEQAVMERKWDIEMFHSIGIEGGYDTVSSEAFDTHVEYLAQNQDVWVAPMGTVSEYIHERDAASVTVVSQNGNSMTLELNCGLDDRFDTPVTLLTDCPPQWASKVVRVQQCQTVQFAEIVSKQGSLYIMYDAIPNACPIELSAEQLSLSISGYTLNSCGVPIEDVTVTADNGGSTATSDDAGYYQVQVPYDWSGTVTPVKADYTFEPADTVYGNVMNDREQQNYTADSIYDLDCSGSWDYGDLGVIAENWLDEAAGNICDLNGDNVVNLKDYAEFAAVLAAR